MKQFRAMHFNQNPLMKPNSQKHPRTFLDTQLELQEQLTKTLTKSNKTLPFLESFRIYFKQYHNSIVRPVLDYEDLIYDQTGNTSFQQKTKKMQFNAAPEMTSDIRGASKVKPYQRLGVPSTEIVVQEAVLFFKIFKNQTFQNSI